MLISARGAATILRVAGVNRDRSRQLLGAGFAGPVIEAGGALLVEADAVRSLAAWPHVDHDRIIELCPEGVYVSRIGPGRSVDLGAQWDDLVTGLDLVPQELSPYTVVFLMTRMEKQGFLPWVATVGGFVLTGADLTTLSPGPDGRPRFTLEPPGPWFESFRGRRFETGPGRPWSIWGWQVFAQHGDPAAKRVLHRTLLTCPSRNGVPA